MSALIHLLSIPVISTNQRLPDLPNSYSRNSIFHSPKLSKLIYFPTNIYWMPFLSLLSHWSTYPINFQVSQFKSFCKWDYLKINYKSDNINHQVFSRWVISPSLPKSLFSILHIDILVAYAIGNHRNITVSKNPLLQCSQ